MIHDHDIVRVINFLLLRIIIIIAFKPKIFDVYVCFSVCYGHNAAYLIIIPLRPVHCCQFCASLYAFSRFLDATSHYYCISDSLGMIDTNNCYTSYCIDDETVALLIIFIRHEQ